MRRVGRWRWPPRISTSPPGVTLRASVWSVSFLSCSYSSRSKQVAKSTWALRARTATCETRSGASAGEDSGHALGNLLVAAHGIGDEDGRLGEALALNRDQLVGQAHAPERRRRADDLPAAEPGRLAQQRIEAAQEQGQGERRPAANDLLAEQVHDPLLHLERRAQQPRPSAGGLGSTASLKACTQRPARSATLLACSAQSLPVARLGLQFLPNGGRTGPAPASSTEQAEVAQHPVDQLHQRVAVETGSVVAARSSGAGSLPVPGRGRAGRAARRRPDCRPAAWPSS